MTDNTRAGAVTAADVVNLATDAGVPPSARPALVLLNIGEDRAADGRLLTPDGWAPLALQCPGWPAGQLDIIGAVVVDHPAHHWRPYLHIGDGLIAVYAATLRIPSGKVIAGVAWRDAQLPSTLTFLPGHWTADDAELATATLRWLEALPRASIGRYALEDDAESGWDEATRRAIDYKARNRCTWAAAASYIGITERQLQTRRKRLKRLPKTSDFGP